MDPYLYAATVSTTRRTAKPQFDNPFSHSSAGRKITFQQMTSENFKAVLLASLIINAFAKFLRPSLVLLDSASTANLKTEHKPA